jgi:hypothetical protein
MGDRHWPAWAMMAYSGLAWVMENGVIGISCWDWHGYWGLAWPIRDWHGLLGTDMGYGDWRWLWGLSLAMRDWHWL